MEFHLVAAEKFRSQRRLVGGKFLSQTVSAKAFTPKKKGFEDTPAAYLQVWGLLP
jgi:hypothetical protein